MSRARILSVIAVLTVAAGLVAAFMPDPRDHDGMRRGAPEAKSLGAMAFGTGNVLFIGDSEGGVILAVEIEDAATAGGAINITGIDGKLAQVLGTTADNVVINDMAVHPVSHNVYLTVTRGRGADARPVLLRVTRNASRPIEEVALDNVRFSSAAIPNAPVPNPGARRNPRTLTVTDLAFADGQVWVAGLSNEEFSSAFRRIAYPFRDGLSTTTLQIYHVSHGQNETNAPVMTFMPSQIGGQRYILAAYTCTPLVAFPADALKDGDHVIGRTVAELGAGNQPVDMISFVRDGQQQILIANSRHPLMRVSAADIANAQALTLPSKEPGIARVPLAHTGIRQLADLDAQHVIVIQAGSGGMDLKSIAKSTL
jgi:hypothetical protein